MFFRVTNLIHWLPGLRTGGLPPAGVLVAERRPAANFLTDAGSFGAKKFFLAGNNFLTYNQVKTNIEHRVPEMSLFSAQWWLHRDNSGEHGP